MKKIIALLLSVLCIVGLFCGCDKNSDDKSDKKTEKATFNFGGCGIEFGMTKEEVNEIGKETVSAFGDKFDIDNPVCSDLITRESFKNIFIDGVTEQVYPKVFYFFDDNDELYCVKFYSPMMTEYDAEIMLNNVINTYGKEDEYDEKDGYSTSIGTMYEFTYEDKDLQVLIAYERCEYTEKFDTFEAYFTAPGYEPPREE